MVDKGCLQYIFLIGIFQRTGNRVPYNAVAFLAESGEPQPDLMYIFMPCCSIIQVAASFEEESTGGLWYNIVIFALCTNMQV